MLGRARPLPRAPRGPALLVLSRGSQCPELHSQLLAAPRPGPQDAKTRLWPASRSRPNLHHDRMTLCDACDKPVKCCELIAKTQTENTTPNSAHTEGLAACHERPPSRLTLQPKEQVQLRNSPPWAALPQGRAVPCQELGRDPGNGMFCVLHIDYWHVPARLEPRLLFGGEKAGPCLPSRTKAPTSQAARGSPWGPEWQARVHLHHTGLPRGPDDGRPSIFTPQAGYVPQALPGRSSCSQSCTSTFLMS
ncbi:hypothetical protein E2C01_047682 [Portunus trituberculatus]|uniref:Uncharacterized protein n=1 Tax=Portunus trituberculatus TaxID=210409 RepID=A0A5B7G1R3_PORTR|nr:hypothetical protein [Portunus trituberculatus]